MFIEEINVIEINPTELCNLKCTFCPRSTFYPNQNLNMSLDTASLIANQLREFNYRCEVSITGRGEPTLHPQFDQLCDIFMEDRTWTLKINTNGKRFEKYYDKLIQFEKIIYNVYDKHETEYISIKNSFKENSNVRVNYKPLELNWFDRPKFTNRAGSFPTNYIPEHGHCEVIFVKLFIDYDGTYRVCCEDWKEKISMGNIKDQTIQDYVENNEELKDYRRRLINGDRTKLPCVNCTHELKDGKYQCTQGKWKNLEWLVKTENLGA